MDQLRVEARFNQAPISGQVPPNHITEGGQQTEDRAVKAQGNRVLGICAHEGGGERDERDAHEEQNVQPDQGAVHAQHEVEHLVVREPIDSQDDETDEECREPRPQPDQTSRQALRSERRGRPELQDEDRHRDGEDSVD